MADVDENALPVIVEYLREKFANTEDGTVPWPGDLTEDERVSYMEICQAEGIEGLAILSVNVVQARAAIANGTLGLEDN